MRRRVKARSQGVVSKADWLRRTRQPGFLPADVPATPILVYRSAFKGWSDFLGVSIVNTQAMTFWSYERASRWAQKQGIKRSSDWGKLGASGQRPKGLPSNPNDTYRSEWQGWGEFLDTGAKHPRDRPRRPFSEVVPTAAAPDAAQAPSPSPSPPSRSD